MERQELRRRVQEILPTLGDVSFYELLGVPRNATEEQIRHAFRDRARVFHVDRYTEDLGDLREPMQRIFGEMSKAHATLTSELGREEYDASLELAGKGVPTDVRSIFQADQAFRDGKRLVERNSFHEAYRRLTQAVELNASEADYWAYLYWAEYGTLDTDEDGVPSSSKRVQNIITQLSQVADSNEHCAVAHIFLGHIHRAQGDTKEARARYQRALQIKPDNADAQSALRLMNMRKDKKPSFLDRLLGKG